MEKPILDFMKSSPMQQARAITALEKRIRSNDKVMPIYEWIEGFEKGLEIGTSKIYSSKSEKGYTEKLTIGDKIVDYKAEQDYYKYLQEGGESYSSYLEKKKKYDDKIKAEQDAKRKEADKIRDEENKKRLKNEQNAKNETIKILIEEGKDAILKRQSSYFVNKINDLKNKSKTKSNLDEIAYNERMIEQSREQVNKMYEISTKLYKIVDGEVVKKYDWKVGDKVLYDGRIETEIINIEKWVENDIENVTYKVEKMEGIYNQYIGYDGLFPIEADNYMEKHTYALTLRPFDIGTYPKENFVRFVEEEADNYKFGLLEYSKELPIETIKHFSLTPVSDLMKYDGKEFYYYEDLKAKAEILKNEQNVLYVEVTQFDENNEAISKRTFLGEDFIEKIKKGDYKIIDDSEAKELEKGIAVEQEHLKTFEKVAAGDITPEQAIVETAQEHIAENPTYYDELEKIETPKIETMQETKLGNDDWAKIPAQNKYATPVKSKAYQYSPYDETFQTITDNFTISDGFRPDFSGVMFNELGISVVTAHRILYINHISEKYNGLYCVSEKCKKSVSDSYIKDDKIDRKSAPYQNYIPNASEFVYDIDLLALKTYCEIITRSGFVRKTTDFIALTFNDKKIIGINGKYLAEAINSFLIMGHRKVKVGVNSVDKGILFVADNDYNGTENPIGKSDFFFIMPVISDSKEFNFAFMQGDIDMDTELNIAYSLEKDAVITKGGEVFHKIDTSITKKDAKDLGELSMEQLQIASSFINSSKTKLPILETVKIENNTFYISNLEQSYSISDVKMPDGIYEIRGSALFPAKYDIDDFPKIPSDFKKIGQINRQELIKNFKHSLDFISNDDLRPVMKGVHFYNNAMNLVIESTDAHALYRNEIKNYNIDDKFDIIISKPKLIYKVLESFDCDEVDFYVQEDNRKAYFECGKGKVYFDSVDGKFPNTEAVYPRDYEKKVVFEAKDLKKLEADIKILAKTSNYKVSQILAMFNFTDGGTANYTLVGSYNEGAYITEHEELESGSIKCEVKEDYSSLYSTFKTLIMPNRIENRNFNLGFRNFNLERLNSLGFDKVELGYTKPERAVVVLNEFVLAGVKKVKNQKKKEVKKKVVEPVVKPIIESKPEVIVEDSAEVKEWKEAIENLNMLLEEGGTDAENTEWREAIDNLNYLIEETPKMAKGGGIGNLKGDLIHKEKGIEYYKNFDLIYPTKEEKLKWEIYGLPNDVEKIEQSFETSIDVIFGKTKKEIQNKLDYNITNGKYNYLGANPNLYLSFDKIMAKGGYLANENSLMVANNNKQIFHHTKEMAEALKGAKNVPAWVVAKVNRSASDLSDATHYLEGAEGMYAEGGEMKGKHYDMEKEIMESQFGKSI